MDTEYCKISREEYKGWFPVWTLQSSRLSVVIPEQIGPRIAAVMIPGQNNIFKEVDGEVGTAGGDVWKIYGGHRLWSAPEDKYRTYAPDNSPIEIVAQPNGLLARGMKEDRTSLRKEIEIYLPAQHIAKVTHRIINDGREEIEVAPWALSVFPEYTQGIIPLPLNQSHESNLLPSSSLAIWSYTHLGDPRILYGDSNISIRNEPQKDIPLKIGLGYKDVTWTWLAAITGDVIFIKSFAVEPSACYPDRGSVSEIYTDRHILELESLGPLTCLNSGECAELTEYWSLMSLPSEGCNHENTPSLLEKIADIANEHQQLSRGSTD